MAVILKDTVPPIFDVAELGYAAVAVYSLLYQSAYQDQRYDQRHCVRRMDCGGTTHWTHKGLADKLGMGKKKKLSSRLTLCLTMDLFNLLECCHLREEVGSACIA